MDSMDTETQGMRGERRDTHRQSPAPVKTVNGRLGLRVTLVLHKRTTCENNINIRLSLCLLTHSLPRMCTCLLTDLCWCHQVLSALCTHRCCRTVQTSSSRPHQTVAFPTSPQTASGPLKRGRDGEMNFNKLQVFVKCISWVNKATVPSASSRGPDEPTIMWTLCVGVMCVVFCCIYILKALIGSV